MFFNEEECPFCALSEDGFSPSWTKIFGNCGRGNEVLWSGDGLSLVLDTAPLREGHVLLVTAEHSPSMRNLDTLGMYRWDQVSSLVRSAYGSVTVFEHGALTFRKNAGACVDHAHVHFVPGCYPAMIDAIRQDFPSLRMYQRRTDALSDVGKNAYLLLEEANGDIFAVEAPMCSTQYLRKLLAAHSGHAERWNWRQCVRAAKALGIDQELIAARSRLLLAMAKASAWPGSEQQ